MDVMNIRWTLKQRCVATGTVIFIEKVSDKKLIRGSYFALFWLVKTGLTVANYEFKRRIFKAIRRIIVFDLLANLMKLRSSCFNESL